MRAPVHSLESAELIWNNGYYLSSIVEVSDQHGIAGRLRTLQPMPWIDRLGADFAASSETGTLVLCTSTAKAGFAHCFPRRFRPAPFFVDLATPPPAARLGLWSFTGPSPKPGGERKPIALALAGQQGTVLARDARGNRVTAAYLPIRNAALGLVLRIDTRETYAPVRRSLGSVLPMTAILIVASVLILQWQLKPLVEKLVRSREQIRHLALHDPLTGLPNRSLMNDRLRMALETGRRNSRAVAVALVDVDGFKQVNDTLGHEAGDDLLRLVASRLSSCVRASDTVARLGGDEFVLILPEIRSREAVLMVADKILAEFAIPVELEERSYFIHLSIGFSVSSPDTQDDQALLRQADMAMYSAKKSGGGRFEVYEQPHGPAAESKQASGELRDVRVLPQDRRA